MASQRDIRRRIGAVKNIKQITRAMQFVAASKLKRAQDATLASRPYSEKLHSGWTWDKIGRMTNPPVRKHLPDQNKSLYTGWSTLDAWKKHSQPRMRWLHSRSQNIGLKWPDCSDAGMIYWLITGDERMSASALKAIFAR